jgi:hypothetical protein
MGWEIGNQHARERRAVASIKKDLRGQPRRWLQRAAEDLSKAIDQDWREWRRNFKKR